MRVGTTGWSRHQSAGKEEDERPGSAKWKDGLCLERGHHLALFLTVYEIVVVLHRYEGREAVVDRII